MDDRGRKKHREMIMRITGGSLKRKDSQNIVRCNLFPIKLPLFTL